MTRSVAEHTDRTYMDEASLDVEPVYNFKYFQWLPFGLFEFEDL